MLIGFNAYGDDDSVAFDTLITLNNFYRIELKDMILDEIYSDTDTNPLIYNTNKELWGFNTIFLGKFQNTLECGNIYNRGVQIEYLIFKKRRKQDLKWQDIAIFNYDKNKNIYEFIDNVVQSTEEYEYMLTPLTSGVMGQSFITEILCEFDSAFIVDKNNSYQIFFNVEYSDIEHIIPSATVETFNTYPTILYSGQTEYQTGQIKGLILSKNTIDNSGVIDAKSERINRETFLKFIKNKKPKIFKDGAGRYLMVVLSNVRETPQNNLQQLVSDISFNWTECGDAYDIDDLINNGFIESGGVLNV